MGRAGETVVEKCDAPCAAQGIAKKLCALRSRTDVAILDPENVITRPSKVCILYPFHIARLRTHKSARLVMS